MSRLAISILILAVSAAACTPTTSRRETLTESPTAETTSAEEPKNCPEGGCPVPDCQGGPVVNAQIDHVPKAVGVKDVDTDVKNWLREIGGAGDATGLPTPQDKIAFLASRDGSDVALLWYVTDGHGGWLRDSYVGCESALKA
jgi:hypothetical protein